MIISKLYYISFSRLQRNLSDEETKQKQKYCINKYINNHDLMTERYLNIMNKQRTVAKQNRLNHSEQTKEEIKKKAKIYFRDRYLKTKDLDSNEIEK
jgi:hypothetical protein